MHRETAQVSVNRLQESYLQLNSFECAILLSKVIEGSFFKMCMKHMLYTRLHFNLNVSLLPHLTKSLSHFELRAARDLSTKAKMFALISSILRTVPTERCYDAFFPIPSYIVLT